MSATVAWKIRRPRRPSIATTAKFVAVLGLAGGVEKGLELEVGQPEGG